MVRKSPSESATLFKVGKRKKGKDGKMWKIVKTKTGVKRWQRITPKKSKKTSRKRSRRKKRTRRKTRKSHKSVDKGKINRYLKGLKKKFPNMTFLLKKIHPTGTFVFKVIDALGQEIGTWRASFKYNKVEFGLGVKNKLSFKEFEKELEFYA